MNESDMAKRDHDLYSTSMNNVINNASWKLTDILIATPIVMAHIMASRDKFDPYDINPATIVIDEFDELLQNDSISGYLLKFLRKYAVFNDKNNPLTTVNQK